MPNKQEYSWGDVLTNCLGIPYTPRKNVRLTCPACGKKKYYANMETGVGVCQSCHADIGNVLKFYAFSRGISTKEAHKEIKQTLGLWTEQGKKVKTEGKRPLKVVPKVETVEMVIAPVEVRDKVYRRMSQIMGLNKAHYENLKKRGHSDKWIKGIGYFSYDVAKEDVLIDTLLSEGFSLEGIPTFWVDKKGKWHMKNFSSSIAVPYFNPKKQIEGIQIRLDKVKEGSSKYFWGAGITYGKEKEGKGTPCNSWCSLYIRNKKDPTLYLTEGAMKAYLISDMAGFNIVAVAGVNSLDEFNKLLQSGYLQKLGIKKIVNAYDMDYLTNKHVFDAIAKVEAMIKDGGFEYERRLWDINYKGYDDYLKHYLNR